jgi:hypothetical protein
VAIFSGPKFQVIKGIFHPLKQRLGFILTFMEDKEGAALVMFVG